jgi:hypothetical protein
MVIFGVFAAAHRIVGWHQRAVAVCLPCIAGTWVGVLARSLHLRRASTLYLDCVVIA